MRKCEAILGRALSLTRGFGSSLVSCIRKIWPHSDSLRLPRRLGHRMGRSIFIDSIVRGLSLFAFVRRTLAKWAPALRVEDVLEA